jgi:hypothetical protein
MRMGVAGDDGDDGDTGADFGDVDVSITNGLGLSSGVVGVSRRITAA